MFKELLEKTQKINEEVPVSNPIFSVGDKVRFLDDSFPGYRSLGRVVAVNQEKHEVEVAFNRLKNAPNPTELVSDFQLELASKPTQRRSTCVPANISEETDDFGDFYWRIDGYNTHGNEGVLSIGVGEGESMGIGGDEEFTATIPELFNWIANNGYELAGEEEDGVEVESIEVYFGDISKEAQNLFIKLADENGIEVSSY